MTWIKYWVIIKSFSILVYFKPSLYLKNFIGGWVVHLFCVMKQLMRIFMASGIRTQALLEHDIGESIQ